MAKYNHCVRNCILPPTPFIMTFWNYTLYSVYLLFSPAITGILGNLCGYCNSKVTEILLNKRLPYDFKCVILGRNVYAKWFFFCDLFTGDSNEKDGSFVLFVKYVLAAKAHKTSSK